MVSKKYNTFAAHISSPTHSLKMTLNQLVDALDAQIVKGDIIAAFNKFAADNCITFSTPEDKTTSKAQKLEALRWFFDSIASVNRIERLASKVGKNSTDSQFVFDFSDKFGNQMVYSEVICRTWKGDQVVEEQYLIGASLPSEKPALPAQKAAATPKKTAATKKAEPVADKKPAAKKSAEPVAAKKTAAPVADKKPAAKKTGRK